MASSPQHEPTMEEILASIRKIISEDSTEVAPAAAPQASADADVLELTQEVEDEPAPVAVAAPPPVVMPEPVEIVPAPEPENDVVFETIEEVSVNTEAQATTAPVHEGIFSDKTRKALEESFASIQAAPAESPAPALVAPIPGVDGASVQAVFEKAVRESFDPVLHQWLGANSDAVVERMKPLIREWLDEHFPALLEGAVRAEVERVARARH